ncbi:cytidylyltransferase domain-containing protein [Methanocalculus sp. MC3]
MLKPCVGIIIQARMGSTRLPNKVLMDLTTQDCILGYLLRRLSTCNSAHKIIVATTDNPKDDVIEMYLKNNNYLYFRGSEPDCLDRFYKTALKYKLDIIVRITADCPLIIPEIVDNMIDYYLNNVVHIDYLSNRQYTNFPEGLDIEIFNLNMLEDAVLNAKSADEREHINYYFLRRSDKYRVRYYNQNYGMDYSRFKLSIDTIQDYERIRALFVEKSLNINFSFLDLMNLLLENENLEKL